MTEFYHTILNVPELDPDIYLTEQVVLRFYRMVYVSRADRYLLAAALQ